VPKVAIVLDSTASLPDALHERYGILKVPYYVHVGNETLRDTVDITSRDICALLESLPLKAKLPTTANPSPGDYERVYREAAGIAPTIISYHMTSDGSGAVQSATVARESVVRQLRGVRIEIVDTRNVSMAHGWIGLEAARAAADGAGLDEIMRQTAAMLSTTWMLQTASTLRYLYMGGRIGRAKHLIGTLLRVMPLISMQDGVIVNLGIARTHRGVFQRMAQLVELAADKAKTLRVALTHASAIDRATELLASVRERVAIDEVLWCELSPALVVHSGPGTVGLCYTAL